MINEKKAQKYCKDDIHMIENYDKAIADSTEKWEVHHRDEIKVLPSWMKVYRSREELIENGRYYNCPANELIFLTHSEHMRLHHKGDNHPSFGKHRSDETKRKMSEARKGRSVSEETRKKMSESHKGEKNPLYGKHRSEATCKKIAEELRRRFSKGNCYHDHEIEPEYHRCDTDHQLSLIRRTESELWPPHAV